MIYKITPPSVTLYAEAADDFLKSVGVELYEEHVVIEEDVFHGTDGEAILNENGIYLYEDHIVLEGQQAEEYKARKAKEKEDALKEEKKRNNRRYSGYSGTGMKNHVSHHPNTLKALDNEEKEAADYKKADDMARREYNKLSNGEHAKFAKSEIDTAKSLRYSDKRRCNIAYRKMRDGTRRQYRRHPEQFKESTIFKSIEFI